MEESSWAINLWDQSEFLLKHAQEQNSTSDKYLKFLLEVQQMHQEIAKKYRKTAASYQVKKKATATADQNELTYSTAFQSMLQSFADMGNVHDQIAKDMNDEVCTQIKTLNDDLRVHIQKQYKNREKLAYNLDLARKKVEASWRAYVAAFKEQQKAAEANQRAQQDDQLPRIEQNKADQHHKNKVADCSEAECNYATELKKYNEFQCIFYTKQNVEFLVELEEDERRRSIVTRNVTEKMADRHQAAFSTLENYTNAFKSSTAQIDVIQDCKSVMEKQLSGELYPANLEFLKLTTCPSHLLEGPVSQLLHHLLGTTDDKMAAKSQNNNNQSGLTSLFRGRKKEEVVNMSTPFIGGLGIKPVKLAEMTVLQVANRLDITSQQMARYEKEYDAAIKMTDIYTKDPQMGDVKATQPREQSLQRIIHSLTQLKGQMEARYLELGGDSAKVESQGKVDKTYGTLAAIDLNKLDLPDVESDMDDDDEDESSPPVSVPSAVPPPASLSVKHVGLATAKYDYAGGGENYLCARAGEVFYVLEFDTDNSGWTAVINSQNKQGFVPTGYMDIKPA